jgi:hypothetical protein
MDKGNSMDASDIRASNRRNNCNSKGASHNMDIGQGKSMEASNSKDIRNSRDVSNSREDNNKDVEIIGLKIVTNFQGRSGANFFPVHHQKIPVAPRTEWKTPAHKEKTFCSIESPFCVTRSG